MKKIQRFLKKILALKIWQWLVLLVLSTLVSLSLLRVNSLNMIKHRQAVLEADEANDSQLIQVRLKELQFYVVSHMNTDMGIGVYLSKSYERDVAKAQEQASQQQGSQGNIYKLAQEVCAPRFSGYSQAYVQCTLDEIAKYPASEELVAKINLPRAHLYLHNYASPGWSPDLAGWSVLITVVILIIIIAKITEVAILKIILKRRYQVV